MDIGEFNDIDDNIDDYADYSDVAEEYEGGSALRGLKPYWR